MPDSREILTTRLEHQLGTLVSRVEIAIRNNLSNSNVVAETTLAGLLNRVYGWNLVNANAISQNYPGVDLIDQERSIAVQVTSSRTTKKVRHTLEEVAKLDISFDRLILVIITHQAVTTDMRACAGTMELWNIPDVFRSAKELDTNKLQEIVTYLEAELGLSGEVPHLELPLSSRLQISGFVGRQSELEEIRTHYARGDQLVVLTGLGGIGKTELAIRYGLEHPGKVYFTRFDTSFTRTLANMALGIRPRLSDDILREEDGALCKRVLELPEKANTRDLLIIDNADSETGTLADLQQDPSYAALTRLPMKVLLTTRSDAPRAISVAPMPDAALIQLFRNHNAQLSGREMADLIRAVNSHTMTIDLIAQTLNGKGWRKVSAADILTALKENTLSSQKYRKIATDYNQSPEQAQIYEHLSVVFNVSGVPGESKAVLSYATLLPDEGMDAECFGSSLEEEEQNALDTLLDRGWLEIKNDLLTIHPVVRLVCRTEIPPIQEGCVSFLNALIMQYDKNNYRKDRYRQIAELLTNASFFVDDLDGNCAGWAATLWRELGAFTQALECDLRAIRKMEENLSPQTPDLATAYNNVGLDYGHLGNHVNALKYLKKALAIRKKVLPKDHPSAAESYNNIGYIYGDLGDHKKALEYQEKALTIHEKAFPEDPSELATAYNNVGYTYGHLGDHEKELAFQQKALAILQKTLSEDHPNLATSYNNIGCTYNNLNDHNKAPEYQKKSLEIQEKTLPANHPTHAICHYNIAWTYHKMGQLQNAARYMRRAADIISLSSLPKNHPDRNYYPKFADHFKKEAKMQQAMMAMASGTVTPPFALPRNPKSRTPTPLAGKRRK